MHFSLAKIKASERGAPERVPDADEDQDDERNRDDDGVGGSRARSRIGTSKRTTLLTS